MVIAGEIKAKVVHWSFFIWLSVLTFISVGSSHAQNLDLDPNEPPFIATCPPGVNQKECKEYLLQKQIDYQQGLIKELQQEQGAIRNGDLHIADPSRDHYEACMQEAIGNHHAKIDGDVLRYDCFGKTAQEYFDYLGNSTERSQKDRYGLWTIRNFRGGICAQHTQNADQSPTSGYDCTISTVAPR
jgi:hypothetical protein